MSTFLDKVDRSLCWPKGADPISQASRWLPLPMYGWQVNVLRDCMVKGNQVTLCTPNGSGKTAVCIANLGLSWMAAFPGSKVISTAGVSRQIEKGLWPVVRQALAPYPRWTISDDKLQIKAPSVRGLPGSEWTAFTTKDPELAEGFHERIFPDENGVPVYAPLLVIMDEAKSFETDEIQFALKNRCDPDVFLMASTPGEDRGPFWDSFNKERDEWLCHKIRWEDCPHLRVGIPYEKRLREIAKRGANDPRVLSWVFGEFFSGKGYRLFDNMQDVRFAMSGMVPEIASDRRAAVDFSGGGDSQVFGYRTGNRIHPLEVFHEKDEAKLAEMLVARFKRLNLKPEEIIADAGGAGKTTLDFMARFMGYPGIQRYHFNAEARDNLMYKYRAAEDHDKVKYMLKRQVLILPQDGTLEEQMRKRQFKVLNDDNRIQMEPKETLRARGEDSPGELDVVVMLCADMDEMLVTPVRTLPQPVCGTVEETMAKWLGDNDAGEAWGSTIASGMMMDE